MNTCNRLTVWIEHQTDNHVIRQTKLKEESGWAYSSIQIYGNHIVHVTEIPDAFKLAQCLWSYIHRWTYSSFISYQHWKVLWNFMCPGISRRLFITLCFFLSLSLPSLFQRSWSIKHHTANTRCIELMLPFCRCHCHWIGYEIV